MLLKSTDYCNPYPNPAKTKTNCRRRSQNITVQLQAKAQMTDKKAGQKLNWQRSNTARSEVR